MNKLTLKKIQKNIKLWLKTATVSDLEELVTLCKEAYYNSGNSILSDADYDLLEDSLVAVKPKSKALKVGHKVELDKVKLPVPMYSLDKMKDDSVFDNFMSKTKSPYVYSDKLDGVSIQVLVKDKKYKLYTRGDGIYGKDISGYAPFLKSLPPINKIPEGFIGRGELIMPESAFKKWDKDFSNARNLVSGVTNRKDIHTAMKDIKVIMYERMDKKLRPSKQLLSLKNLGFSVVKWEQFEVPTFNESIQYLNKRKRQAKTAIDGIVIYEDKPHILGSGNPTYAKALKVNAESDMQLVTVKEVVWQVSRQGRLTPVVNIEPVRMQGVTVTKVTAHNGANVIKKGIGKGAVIKIIRSGDVIPYIVDVVKPVKVTLPKNTELRGEFLYTLNDDHNNNIKSLQILHFFTSIGVDGLKIGSITKMIKNDYVNISDFLTATKGEYTEILGVNGGKIYNSIKVCMKNLDLPTLLVASGTITNWSYERFNLLVSHYPNLMQMKSTELSKISIKGIGNILMTSLIKGLPAFKLFIKENRIKYSIPSYEKIEGKLSNETFCFTGVRDKNLEQELISNGANVTNSFTKAVTTLVAKDVNSSSSKVVRAKQLGIKVLSLSQAYELL